MEYHESTEGAEDKREPTRSEVVDCIIRNAKDGGSDESDETRDHRRMICMFEFHRS